MSENMLLIQRAGEAVKVGDKRQAHALLLQAIRQDARDHIAWLGLARLTESPSASLDYAQRAHRLKPDDPLACKVLAWAERRAQAAEKSPATGLSGSASAIQPAIESVGQPVGQPASVNGEEPTTIPWKTAVIGVSAAIFIIFLGLIGFYSWTNQRDQALVPVIITPPSAGVVALAQVEQNHLDPSPNFQPSTEATATITPTPRPTQPSILPKNIADSKENVSDPRATWTITPSPTNTPTPTNTPVPTFVSPSNQQPVGRPFGVGPAERWVDVNLSSQSLTAYEGDTAVMNTFISSGLPTWPTVTGQFRIYLRFASQTMDGTRLGYDYYLTGVPWVMYFYEDYALHGTFWHSNFGYPMSHGCVNMYTPDANWLFNWSTIGTVVNVHY